MIAGLLVFMVVLVVVIVLQSDNFCSRSATNGDPSLHCQWHHSPHDPTIAHYNNSNAIDKQDNKALISKSSYQTDQCYSIAFSKHNYTNHSNNITYYYYQQNCQTIQWNIPTKAYKEYSCAIQLHNCTLSAGHHNSTIQCVAYHPNAHTIQQWQAFATTAKLQEAIQA